MKFGPKETKELNQYLRTGRNRTREFMVDLVDDLGPGSLKDELLKDFDSSQETYEEYLQRKSLERPFNMADGGMLVKPGFGGVRQGYSGEYGPNIRLSTTGANTFEVQVVRGGKRGGKGGKGQRFYKNFKFDDYGGKQGALKAAKAYRDSVKNIPKATGTIITKKRLEAFKKAKGRLSETGKNAEIRKILNQFIAEGRTSFSNEDVRNLIDKDLFDDDLAFKKTVDKVKKESPYKNLNFIVKPRDRADYFTDPFIRNKIKENYKKLKQESLAKLIFPDEPLTTSKSRLGIILSDMADKGEIERLKVGEASEERLKDFDTSPEAEKKAKIAEDRRKKIDILGGKEYEKELFNFKKDVQESLGLEKVKKGKYDPIDMGHQSSIKQLKALKQRLRPEDLSPQFYKANQLGIQKYEGGVKTLENSLNRKFYPEQKKLYKQAQKFINAGKAVPEDLQNKIIKSNERIQIFIDDTVKKYPLLKDRVNAVTIDPINLNVKRGGNVFKQLGIGLVDQDLGNIKVGSLDDLTIKANLAEQTLKEATDAGLIDKNIGRQRLDKFLSGAGKVLKGVGKVVKPLGVGFGVNALKTAITKADEQGLKLNLLDKAIAFDSGDAELALNNARRRVDPQFAAQERAKDLAQMSDDFEEVGQQPMNIDLTMPRAFAMGGLSGGVKSGPPPERGPNPQGLLSLMKRARNY